MQGEEGEEEVEEEIGEGEEVAKEEEETDQESEEDGKGEKDGVKMVKKEEISSFPVFRRLSFFFSMLRNNAAVTTSAGAKGKTTKYSRYTTELDCSKTLIGEFACCAGNGYKKLASYESGLRTSFQDYYLRLRE